jgi:hypothetical protein
MARPQRNVVDYFPHYISSGKKMYYIEQKYGNDGFASWFKILESLAVTEFHFLNLNEETELMFLASKCRVSEETLLNILDDLSRLGEINAEMWLAKIIWSDKFIESIQDAYSKRSNECMSFEGLRLHLRCLGVIKGDVKPQSKVKDIKLNESKEDEPSSPPVFSFLNSLISLGVEDQTAKDWMKVRKEKKATNTETALKAFLTSVEKSGKTVNEVVKICAENSWKGFNKDWLTNSQPNQKNNVPTFDTNR